jgi:C4-dicarboxylate-specific signal transduction histidine kinase
MLMLAFALADRFNEIRRERAKAQREALEAQTALVETLKSSERLLEERVEQRTAELSTANVALNDAVTVAETSRQHAEDARQQATQALDELRAAQVQLVQSEKMASLGQLVSNIAHEINTPIGAVKSSGKNITDALDHSLAHMPRVFQHLDTDSLNLFLQLIGRANRPRPMLSSREERAIIREVTRELENAGLAEAHHKADILVQLNAQLVVDTYLPLLRNTECDLILETASSIAKIINNTSNINAAVDRVSKIIFALKSFSRADNLGEKADVQLQDEIETVLTIYQSQLRQGTQVIRQFDAIPAMRCIPDELNQVWSNLIHNALQAMNHKGTLTIGIHQQGGDAVVSVGDTGCGIPDDIRDKIFDPFFTTKAAGEGSGLGLDIVRKIVDRHLGRIEVRSTVGVGTTFIVHLPYPSQEIFT